jgi:uncharacterized protein (TIGR01777 family)
MRVVIAGGSGQIGQILARRFLSAGHDVVILCRSPSVPNGRVVPWDGRSLGAWASEIDGAEVVINLAGRTVNCRYTAENLKQMLDSRVESTRVVGAAIATAAKPPSTWLQMSTATIYAHRTDAANGELHGIIGGNESGVPAYWAKSVNIAQAWEATLAEAKTPNTRKVALRASMVMSPDRGGIFDVLLGLVRKGLGGTAGRGDQFVSWIHDEDLCRALSFLLEHKEIDGAINLASPNPLPNRDFMRELRNVTGTRIGLPASAWMLEIGAWMMRTDTELLLKSRRVVPERLLAAGFDFQFPTWSLAASDLVKRWRALS